MKHLSSAMLAAALAAASFALPASARAEAAPASCVGLMHYDANGARVCTTGDILSRMSLAQLDDVAARIEATALRIAAINSGHAKAFAVENGARAMRLYYSLYNEKKDISFGGESGESLDSIVAEIGRIASENAVIDAKRAALERLSRRLSVFSNTGGFPD